MQNFHQRQDHAQGMTRALCLLLVISVVGTIVVSALALAGVAVASTYGYLSATTKIDMPFAYWQDMFWDRLIPTLGLSALTVGGVAIYESLRLAEGGGRLVARSLGGTRVLENSTDPACVKLLHVVEEMAIASGLPAPPVFVLEDEPGINAFAAGFKRQDTVIGVTRGVLDRLKRQQLQGVIAHEFGHIAKGDVRLNIGLLGILTGIQALSFASHFLIRMAIGRSHGSSRSVAFGHNPLGMVLSLVFGLALWPIGQVGALFSQLITFAVNRQREFLADACAVQFTRDPNGLRQALEAIRDDERGSHVQRPAARLAGHMFFAGVEAWGDLFQTHPPLEERIRRLNGRTYSAEAELTLVAADPQPSVSSFNP